MHPALSRLDHRPWPLPSARWTWRQAWCDLLFAHWPVPAAVLRPLVPPELTVQEWDGTSWVAVVPFRMEGVMRRPLPDLPWISAFPELNLRLYVERDGIPGVWFLSLDATNPLAVLAARRLFHLPYFRADITMETAGSDFLYRSKRRRAAGGGAFRGRYRPTSEPYEATPGTLEHWLTERYCLYAADPRGRLYRAEVHHAPWPLQRAEAEIEENSLFAGHFPGPTGPPALLHFARRIEVVMWSPLPVVA
ncbi:MAG TPA: DUF2071 domain-containing protein [Thermoanaerobaculia bacterium]|nr:DUF2071 domain-containing protein [Thermoanaerobaculia bacterium]